MLLRGGTVVASPDLNRDSHVANSIRKQLRSNAVAIISLVVAVSSLGYNTWRNERTEANRNVRHGGFELLLKLGELQEVVFFGHYDQDSGRGNPRTGWAFVLVIDDLSRSLPEPVPSAADRLLATWGEEWQGLGQSDASVDRISAAIDELRTDVLNALDSLD